MMVFYPNKEEKEVANDWAAEVATTAGVNRVMSSITAVCSWELRPKIAQMTRPKCSISTGCFALTKPQKACFK